MQERYKTLGLSEGASEEEIIKSYNLLKEKYQKERFLEGDAGNEAAKNLTKLETAYAEIMESLKEKANDMGKSDSLETVERYLKDGRISEAQAKLDDIYDRNAEWHYLQSVVFYKKNWYNESKKQLEIAMDMEPKNYKYSDAYTKLKQKMEYNERQFYSNDYHQYNNQGYQTQSQNNRQMGNDGINDCLSFCATWCCMNMLCNSCCG